MIMDNNSNPYSSWLIHQRSWLLAMTRWPRFVVHVAEPCRTAEWLSAFLVEQTVAQKVVTSLQQQLDIAGCWSFSWWKIQEILNTGYNQALFLPRSVGFPSGFLFNGCLLLWETPMCAEMRTRLCLWSTSKPRKSHGPTATCSSSFVIWFCIDTS